MTIDTEFQEKIRANLMKYYRIDLGLPNWEDKADSRIRNEDTDSMIEVHEIECNTGPIAGRNVLSVGSGWGGFAVASSKKGAIAFGIEPDIERIEISKLRAVKNGAECVFCKGIGENLPFKENSFDIVDCHSVLEHVRDPEAVIKEMVRILKTKGVCHIHAPNYMYPAEPHYKIYWFPMMPKPVAAIYLRLLSRNPEFLQHLNYITPRYINRILSKIGCIEVKDAGLAPEIRGSGIERLLWNLMVSIYAIFGMERRIDLYIYKMMEG